MRVLYDLKSELYAVGNILLYKLNEYNIIAYRYHIVSKNG